MMKILSYISIFFFVCLCLSLSTSSPYLASVREARAGNWASTTVLVIVVCGDGTLNPGEICDKGEPPETPPVFGGLTCNDYGFADGDLRCADDCMDIFDNLCFTCGNSHKEEVEECDGSDFGGATCQTFGFNTGHLSCTANCKINLITCVNVGIAPGVASGGAIGGGGSRGGGSSGFQDGRDSPLPPTKLVIKGTAYPNSEVHILKDGAVLGLSKADQSANFSYENTAVTPGVSNFSFWSTDKNDIKSTLYTLTFKVASNAVTTINGVYLPPTIGADKVTLKSGEDITIFGQSIPFTDIFLEIHSEENILKNMKSDDDGEWSIIFNTSQLEKNINHTAKSYFQKKENGAIVNSSYSSVINFFLGDPQTGEACAGADLNKDKKVNLTDFSILLYNWGTNNACADQNQNGKVDLTDFSIMMYYWTG